MKNTLKTESYCTLQDGLLKDDETAKELVQEEPKETIFIVGALVGSRDVRVLEKACSFMLDIDGVFAFIFHFLN